MVGNRRGATVNPAQCSALFEKGQVAAHGFGRYPEATDELVRADRLRGAYRIDDRLMTLNRQHG